MKNETRNSMVTLRFYGELNDFLSQDRKFHEFSIPYTVRNSVKDVIESLGPPHTEVDLILVNGRPVEFPYIVESADRISVYPEFRSIDVSGLPRLRQDIPTPIRFVLDTHLGKLARYLRLLGFDALYQNDWNDFRLAELAASGDKRILLTRDRGLLKHGRVIHGCYIRSDDPESQVKEMMSRYRLKTMAKPFSRCIRCNGSITSVKKERIRSALPEVIAQTIEEFTRCKECGKIYWKGSHYDRLQRFIETLFK
jgi:uncharacterized protein